MNQAVIPWSRRVLGLAAIAASALVLGLWLGTARAADQRLDLADESLTSAAALLQASQDPTSGKAQRQFEKAIARAVQHIEDARAQIVVGSRRLRQLLSTTSA